MKNPSFYKGIVFDLDGTLLDTIDDIADAMNIVMKNHGFNEYDTTQYKLFIGDGLEQLVRRAIPEKARSELLIQRCIRDMSIEYGRAWKNRTQPYEGVSEMLDILAGHGLRLAILSNKPDEFTKRMVQELLPSWHFHPLLGARDGIPRKPDPTAALGISREWKLDPDRCILLGDSEIDIATAKAAGMTAAGAAWGFRPPEMLRNSGADLLFYHPVELANWLILGRPRQAQ